MMMASTLAGYNPDKEFVVRVFKRLLVSMGNEFPKAICEHKSQNYILFSCESLWPLSYSEFGPRNGSNSLPRRVHSKCVSMYLNSAAAAAVMASSIISP